MGRLSNAEKARRAKNRIGDIIPEGSVIKIEKGIPFPRKRNHTGYPLTSMDVDDSFVVNGNEIVAVRQAMTQYGKRNGKTFASRYINDGAFKGQYRVWRLT